MFAQQQTVSATLADNGLIAIDEHTSVSCMIHDVTATGLSLTLLDGAAVPGTFVLFVGAEIRVCRVVRRADEEIEASFADLTRPGQSASAPVTARRTGTAFGRRLPAQDRTLRRAA